MAHDEGEACVYVKESVLRELEQERRRLKWQLSRALQTSDTQAAELQASKAKVKDLLTIVEVNKGVADQAVRRSHGQDVKRRAELETLHQQNKQQRLRYLDLALRSINRRVRDRQQRGAFHLLQRAIQLRSRRREALLRLQTRFRWRTLHRGLGRWKHFCYMHEYGVAASCNTESAKVYPLSPEQLHIGQPTFIPRTISTTVKVDNSRWQLLRKVWRNWERVVRSKRRHREFMEITLERLLRLVFLAWTSRLRILRRRKNLLRRILARTKQRLQQLGLTRFRMRCAEVSAHEWAEVLRTAHTAMEEERKLRADVQSSVAGELHTAYIREQHRQQRFTKLQAQRLEDFKRRECKQRTLMTLRYEMIRTRQKNAIALRFQRLQHYQRVMRRLFKSWKRETSRSRHTKAKVATWDARRTRSIKATCFRLLAWTLHRRRQQRLRLRALMSKLQRAWLLKGWLSVRIRSAIEEHKATAHVVMWQLSQQVEAIQAVCHETIGRSRKIALKYRITCAIFMADKKQENLLRKMLRSWSARTAANARQRRALRRLLARRHVKALRGAVQKWIYLNEDKTVRCNQLHKYQLDRRHRVVVRAFDMWKRYTHVRLRLRLANYQQRAYFRAWCRWYYLGHQRVQWVGRFVQRSNERCQRQAFQFWKFKHDHYVKVCTRREAAENELISRLWRRWIGFVAFRSHKQRRQHEKALSGVRRALHRTMLFTAFESWRTNWRRSQSLEKLVVRACRRNTSHGRIKKYLQTWHQHSALMARRRAALHRIFRRQKVRLLQSKWHDWIRASLWSAITKLETSSIRAQQQVDSVAQSTSRANILRRTFQKWRLLSNEAKRQQRRRALFVEKRRYMMLQGTLRQWQRTITCCSLTKRHRMLQHLLSKLQISLERQAFRHWERRTYAKTLYERDRISAELFRRSEIRVMVLSEEIRAERERRVVFTSWRSITARKKKACESLHTILFKDQHRFLQNSWIVWTLYTRTQRCVVRLMTIIDQRQKAAAWRKLLELYHHYDLRSAGARLAGVMWHKIRLRHAWNQWKRTDSLLSKHTALAEATISVTQSMLAFKETVARRHHRKQSLKLVLVAWKHQVSSTTSLRQHLHVVLGRRVEATTAYHFQRWRKVVERQSLFQEFLYRVVKRQQTREVRSALARWRRWILETAHRQQLEQTKRALSHQREVITKRIAVVKFLSWQRPCLEAHFVRWKVHVEQRRRYVVGHWTALSRRRTYRLLQRVWFSWYGVSNMSKRRAQLLQKVLKNTRTALVAHGFYRWDQWNSWMQGVDESLIRLMRIHNLWQWRRGFSALRQHHHEDTRRQSVMAASVFSAHNARQREHQSQMMRAIALVLQRKSSAALCDRCFRHWLLYMKSKAKTKLMIRMAHVRSQKRMIRRCFIEWQLNTRQNIIIRQKIHRRQETWQSHHQRRIWNAWVYITQHSIEVKHLIYDRLVICALRHSLQGAWGRWKTYARHANALHDAQRVAQWESAAAERDKVMNTLEDKHERVLLRAAQLGQQNNTLRQRLVSSAAMTIHRVVDLRLKSRVATAFHVWQHKLLQLRVLQSRITALALRYRQLALQRWHSSISQQRTVEQVKRGQRDTIDWAARVVHTYALQWLKQRTFLSWKTVVRAHQGIKRHLAVAKRRREFHLVRRWWANWKSILVVREQQHHAVTILQARKKLKTVLQAYWQWRRVHERSGITKHNAIRTLVVLHRVWQHRRMIYRWIRWRNFAIEEDAAALHTKLVLVELEHEKAAEYRSCSQLLLRTFSTWRMYACSEYERREWHARVLGVSRRRCLLLRHLECWKRKTASIQIRLMLLRRTNRHLRRHYMTLTKFALWVWFARTQADSRALTQLQVASKQFTPWIDVSARIARALVIDVLLAEHQLFRLKQRSAWQLVNATVRNAQRRMLQTAFDRFASGVAVRSKRRFLTPMHVANARAFVDRLTLVLQRSGFQHWKQQYLALAIQEAEEAQQELLRALHHVTSYRQALDPYANQS